MHFIIKYDYICDRDDNIRFTVYTDTMNKETLRIVQISDMHLFEDVNATLQGRNTWRSFLAVRDLVLAEHPHPDMIVLTGDLSQDESDASYRHVAEALLPFTCPIYFIPGNHDRAADLTRVMKTTQCLADKEIVTQAWHILLLDCTVIGKVFGEFSEQALKSIQEAVQKYPDKYLMIFLHHHPIPIHVSWLDRLGLQDPEKFLRIARAHPKLRIIAWGHIHQQFEKKENEVHYLSVPSTCIQFSPDSDTFALDRRLPGYRFFELSEKGIVKTQVHRLTQFNDGIDYASSGY